MFANVGSNPEDLYRDFDSETVRQFHLDEGGVILDDLMPLGRSLPVGRMISEYARASGMGGFRTSMSGETDVIHDKVDYDLDDAIVPVHQNGFQTTWREQDQLSLDGFDDARVKQSESTRTHRRGLVRYLLDGTDITHKGVGWNGFRSDSRLDQVDLSSGPNSFDFTSALATGEQFEAAFRALAERRYIDNNITMPACYYVSNQIYFNIARDYSTEKGDNTIMQRLLAIPGVAAIKPTSELVGNQILSLVLSRDYIEPLVAMGVSTIALPVTQYNSPIAFDTVSVMGIQLKRDFENGNTAAQYAAG
jgi:hypothetical protein